MSTLKVTHLQNESNAEPAITISSAGEIGIGTETPRDPVHIFHPTNNVNLLIESGDANSYLAFKDNATTSDAAVYLGAEGNNLKFITSATERLRITSGGLVDISGGVQVSENITPTSGEGVEIFAPSSGIGQIQSFDRTNNNFDKFIIKGDPVEIYDGSTKKLETTSAGLIIHEDTNKTISFTGGIGEIGNVTGFQALNTAGSALVDFGMRATTLRFATGSAERLRITSGGEVQIANGNLKFSTAGTGIDFSATSDASGKDNELLDDYEEGTWTPTSSDVSISTSNGHYIKIGRLVTITARVNFPTNSNNGTTNIGGLPFAVDDDLSNSAMGGAVGETTYTGSDRPMAAVEVSDVIRFRINGGTSMTNANWSNKSVRFSLTYFAGS